MFVRNLSRHIRFNSNFAAPEKVIVQRVGAFRGGVVGFLLGISSAGAAAYVYLLDEYQQSSLSLLSGVEDLQKTTTKLRDYTKKIDKVEETIKGFPATYATKKDLEDLRNELLKAIDNVVVDGLETKTLVWELSQKK
ncbi:hypothetical protein HDV06_003506 [Boothiomyces sp. JEL0866]|nr:hypothetical protein HDV06_003475 [Boothiomyces sp. JEL0866]KAJ3325736.1 hypothetical protein HDV06_003506 [Boothiomyces sp. JEL0866]